ncbi:MAG: phospholipid carrier-dependent glycosyltransferase [Rhodopirellula sp.]|nr:phospholipid carrier-dependent glycosyltransferase [Rhodopirellula sp.]
MLKVAPFAYFRHTSRRIGPPILVLTLLAVLARLPGINRPLVGNFATRNVVSAMVARNWAEGRATLWYPTVDCLAGEHRQWILLEFPVSTYLTASLWKWLSGSLDAWGRGTSIGLIAASVAMIYLLVGRRHGPVAAAGAAFALAVSPVSVVFGQSFMLEPSLVFFTVVAFYAQDRWLEGGRLCWLGLAAAALALAILTKVYMLVLLLPLAVEAKTSLNLFGPASSRRRKAALLAIALAVLPSLVWYAHAATAAAPDGPYAERVFYSVRQSADVHRPPHPLLKTPDFYRQVLDDLASIVLTPVGFTIALAAFLHRSWRRYAPWLAALAVLIAGLPLKFYEMNYYWLPVLPALCILAGLGWRQVCRRLRLGGVATALLALTVAVFSLRYSVKPAFVTPPEDRAVAAAGRAAGRLAAPDEPVVAMHGSTIDLLYYCDRPGWAVAPDTPELKTKLIELHGQKARWLVYVAGSDRPPRVLGELPVRLRGEGYTIHDLSRLPPRMGAQE